VRVALITWQNPSAIPYEVRSCSMRARRTGGSAALQHHGCCIGIRYELRNAKHCVNGRIEMAQSSIIKPVAAVTFLSLIAVLAIDRQIAADTIVRRIRELVPNRSTTAVKDPAQVAEPPGAATRKRSKANTKWTVTMSMIGWRIADEPPVTSPLVRPVVRPGLSRAEIEEMLGGPAVRITETNNGKVVEQYIYVATDQNTKRVVMLENGRGVPGEANR
jgi:hypothetical protein